MDGNTNRGEPGDGPEARAVNGRVRRPGRAKAIEASFPSPLTHPSPARSTALSQAIHVFPTPFPQHSSAHSTALSQAIQVAASPVPLHSSARSTTQLQGSSTVYGSPELLQELDPGNIWLAVLAGWQLLQIAPTCSWLLFVYVTFHFQCQRVSVPFHFHNLQLITTNAPGRGSCSLR